MKGTIFFNIILLVFLSTTISIANSAILVHNSKQDIEQCRGKLILELVRVWGGDDEEDENKIFKTPTDIRVSSNNRIYILDLFRHHVKVFDREGKYLFTFGRKGRGPGDMYMPSAMDIGPDDNIVVTEFPTRRIQLFSSEGKSLKIIKRKNQAVWVGLNSKSQYIVHERFTMLGSRKILMVWDKEGNVIRHIGTFHDKATSPHFADSFSFALDENDCVYVCNSKAPVIRRYTPDGSMNLAVTYEPPFEIPVKVTLNDSGDEIRRIEPQIKGKTSVSKEGDSVSINKSGKRRPSVSTGIAVDSQDRIFLISKKKTLTGEEMKNAPHVYFGKDYLKVVNKIDLDKFYHGHFQLLVFGADGKIIAKAPFNELPGPIYIKGNRIFIVERFFKKHIVEFQFRIEEKGAQDELL